MENIENGEVEPELMYWTPLEQKCAVYRGQIIHYATKAESLLDEIIAHYFCHPDKQIEFIYGCLNKEFFGLKAKKETLIFILTQKYKLLLEKYPTLNIDFEKFINDRNDCAHRKFSSYADVNKDSLDGNIFLQHFKTKKNIMCIENIPINLGTALENISKVIDMLSCIKHHINDTSVTAGQG